jgi:hypothetical protein
VTEPSDEELEAAVQALSEPGRFDEAEQLVARAAPQLQRILAQALEAGGWFGGPQADELRKVLSIEDSAERERALHVLLAEETRMGMMVGVAVGWALAQELESGSTDSEES